MDKSLTTNAQELGSLESIIAEGLQTFVEVGTALAVIRDKELYRLRGYDTFAGYCTETWNLNQNQVAARIEANEAVAFLLESGIAAPTKQSHALVLARIDEPALRAIAWQEACAVIPPPITTAKLAGVVSKYLLMNDYPILRDLVVAQKMTAQQIAVLADRLAGAGKLAAPIMELGVTMQGVIDPEAIKPLVQNALVDPDFIEDVYSGYIYLPNSDDPIPLFEVTRKQAEALYQYTFRERIRQAQAKALEAQQAGKPVFVGEQVFDLDSGEGEFLGVVIPNGISPATLGRFLEDEDLRVYMMVIYRGNPLVPFGDKRVRAGSTDVLSPQILEWL